MLWTALCLIVRYYKRGNKKKLDKDFFLNGLCIECQIPIRNKKFKKFKLDNFYLSRYMKLRYYAYLSTAVI